MIWVEGVYEFMELLIVGSYLHTYSTSESINNSCDIGENMYNAIYHRHIASFGMFFNAECK